jgi:hypothetical protein
VSMPLTGIEASAASPIGIARFPHPPETTRLALANGRNGADSVDGRHVRQRQRCADSGRSRDGNRSAQVDPNRPSARVRSARPGMVRPFAGKNGDWRVCGLTMHRTSRGRSVSGSQAGQSITSR